jgi:hypothetical protein
MKADKFFALLLGTLVALSCAEAQTITINPAVTHQTMVGWEATAFSMQADPSFPLFKDTLFDQAVADFGINRVRLEIRSGSENSQSNWLLYSQGSMTSAEWRCRRYSTVNDNNDPNTINAAGFHFNELDDTVDKVVLPLKQRLAAQGEQLYINLNYVGFTGQIFAAGCPAGLTYIHDSAPAEYAEFVIATYLHLQSKYGFVPDTWEVMLEPDNNTLWNATEIGQAIVAAGARLAQNGFTPRFIAPSTTNGPLSRIWWDQIITIPGALQYISELSYHRYVQLDLSTLAEVAQRAQQSGKMSAMLEWIGADYNILHEDLKIGHNSSWSQFTLAGSSASDDGGKYYLVNLANPQSPVVSLSSRARFIRQYFKRFVMLMVVMLLL